MSKKSKKQAQGRRLSMKRARKDSAQKQYQQWAAEGANKKSKRNRLNKKRAISLTTKKHGAASCGNHGCEKCNSLLNSPAYALPGTWLYRKRFMPHTKPYKTSKEKLTRRNRKLAA